MATKIILVNDIDSNNVVGTLDVTETIPFPISLSISDIKDLGAKGASASKTVKLPGTANNNQVFSSIFDVAEEFNVLTYNIRKKQKCVIVEDGKIVFDNAFIQLTSVIKKQNSYLDEGYIEYEILIKSALSDYFQKIYNTNVSDLDFTNYDHDYTLESISSASTHNISRGYKYVYGLPEGSNDENNIQYYTLNSVNPALYTKTIFDVIHDEIGYNYEIEETNTTAEDRKLLFKKLLNIERPVPVNLMKKFNENYMVKFITKENEIMETSNSIGYTNYIWDNVMTGTIVEYDPNSAFNYSACTLTKNFSIKPLENSLDVNFNSAFSCTLRNIITQPLFVKNDVRITLSVLMYKADGAFLADSVVIFDKLIPAGTEIPNGTIIPGSLVFDIIDSSIGTEIIYHQLSGQFSHNEPYFGASASDRQFSFKYKLNTSVPFEFVNSVGYQDPSFQCIFDINKRFKGLDNSEIGTTILTKDSEAEFDIKYGGVTIPIGGKFPIAAVVPNMTIKDYLLGIINIYNFNLVVDENSRTIKYYTRNYFYDQGPTLDWTDKLNRNLDQKVEFLSLLTDKNITLTYKADTDDYNKKYTESTNKIYNQVKVIMDTEWLVNSKTITLPFSPTPEIPVTYGIGNFLIPTLNFKKEMNSRILFSNKTIFTTSGIKLWSTNEIPILAEQDDYDSSFISSISLTTNTYSVTDFGGTRSFEIMDLGYAKNDYEYYTNFSPFDEKIKGNTLYDLFWARTFNQVNNSRLLTAYFNLNNLDISNKELLRSKINIDNSWWVINKIIDYDVTSKNPTQVELIQCEQQMLIKQ